VPEPGLVDPATVAPVPWRNGGGLTRPLAEGEGWRVSLADLTGDGPFSAYAGWERTFVPLDGGFVLVVDGVEHATVARQPVVFDGGAEVSLHGLVAPTRALNLMTRGCRGGVRLVPAAEDDDGQPPAAARVALGAWVARIEIEESR